MNENTFELVIQTGALAGQKFSVGEAGLRLGRSSSCEMSVSDPELSRNHCLFERRADGIYVTDLASANGTYVNDNELGNEPHLLKKGDVISAGQTRIMCGEEVVAAAPVDLGLGKKAEESKADAEIKGNLIGSLVHCVLWLLALGCVGLAVYFFCFGGEEKITELTKTVATPKLRGIVFEKVEADADGIYRYQLVYDSAKSTIQVDIDDVPKQNRHVRKSANLSKEAVKNLEEIFKDAAFYQLEVQYSGVGASSAELKSSSFRVIRSDSVFNTSVENTTEPEVFRTVREKLEAFSKSELGIWAIQYSAEKLQEMSAEARAAADAKWEERDVQHGNVAAALAGYDEAVFLLDTVNPKPEGYEQLVERRREVQAEMKRRYSDQRFLADRALNLGDWATAQKELRILCEMVPDERDERNAEARAKLMDVETRMRKGK